MDRPVNERLAFYPISSMLRSHSYQVHINWIKSFSLLVITGMIVIAISGMIKLFKIPIDDWNLLF